MKIQKWIVALAALLVWGSTAVELLSADEAKEKPNGRQQIDFVRDIQPIFVRHCYKCHGPKKQESDYRLDRKSSAVRGGDLGERAIVPGKSGESFLWQAVSGPDSDVVMPPEGPRLSRAELERLKTWIDRGAVWPGSKEDTDELATDHWSFQPLGKPSVPHLGDPWVATPVDGFILAGLKEKNLQPATRATQRELIRRLYLDVHGLLPTPAEVEQFAADKSPDAYQRLVERVLASPRYGERWARHWLDVVRFAETDGFEMNQERAGAYHYRDWVIRALNADEPYDRFLQKQLAGDALGDDAATGFLVGGAYDKVKSPDINLTLMQRQDELADMINTTGTVFLGLTIGCARCHNHKFDPIPQKDYYAWQAVFAGVRHGNRPLPSPEDEKRHRLAGEKRKRLAVVEQELGKIKQLADAGEKLSPDKLRTAVNAKINEEHFVPVSAKYIRFTVAATNNGSEPCIDELEIYSTTAGKTQAANVALLDAGAKATSSGDLSGFAIHKLQHVHDGRYGNGRSWISNTRGSGWVQIELPQATNIDRIVWGRDRQLKYKDRLAIRYKIEVAVKAGKWQQVISSSDRKPYDGKSVSPGEDEIRLANLPPKQAQRAKQLLQEKQILQKQIKDLSLPATMIYAGKFVKPEPTHRLYRGDPLQKREVVVPDALSVLGSLNLAGDTPEQRRRLALARWMSLANNPLAARVIVNRIWQYHFGTGIVATPSDFGAGGVGPSHPKLLDWLAGELLRSGWSMKHIHRLILTSNVYRQSSAPSKQGLAVDAGGRRLWRFPPRRLEAEAIRDNILQASGALGLTMYGPGFSPFEPNKNYVRVYKPKQTWSSADWRRMVYMTKVRMEHDAVFGAFDCPDAGQPTPRRTRSTTAVQALNLLNSKFMLQQSELFAQRVEREVGGQIDRQIERVFALTLGRQADQEEAAAAVKLISQHGLTALCRAMFNTNEFLFLP